MNTVDLSSFNFKGSSDAVLPDLRKLDKEDAQTLLMAGIDTTGAGRSGSYLNMDHGCSLAESEIKGLEIMDIRKALKKYGDLDGRFNSLVPADRDEFTKIVQENLHGGYFVRVAQGVEVKDPVQSCLFIKSSGIGQAIHNVVIVEDNAKLHLITGCSVAKETKHGAHVGISEFFVGKNAELTFTMVHNWSEDTLVRPRTTGVVEAGGSFVSNYVLLKPVKDVQMYPTINLNGEGAVARFNSVIVAPTGSYVDSGNRVLFNAPNTRAEIVARTVATGGGVIINRGFLGGNAAPAKGHLECRGLIIGSGRIHAIPELDANADGVELSHEAAVGKIAQEEIEYLMARGLDEEEATSTIVRGFMNVDIMGLPETLKKVIDDTVRETQQSIM